ncbi:MAG: hypothetical protein ABIJ16_01085 [Bacteroidota bacterium]
MKMKENTISAVIGCESNIELISDNGSGWNEKYNKDIENHNRCTLKNENSRIRTETGLFCHQYYPEDINMHL